jgi:hypothetical protein
MALGLIQFVRNAHFSKVNLPELQAASSLHLQARIRMGGIMPLGPAVNCTHEKDSLLEDKMEVFSSLISQAVWTFCVFYGV